ncbi:MAG TPA: hypothetical protein VLL05_22150 [Terriglobales bacterium]|nr:hypothetical protein [Terriglobales bacterium]
MKIASICFAVAIALLVEPTVSSAKTPKHEDPWLVLNRVTHKRDYVVETRNHECVAGTIREVTANHLTAKIYKVADLSTGILIPETVTFPRADVLRVSSGKAVYYSGRSSWSDVASIRATGRERLQVVTKVGAIHLVKPPYTVSDESISFESSRSPAKLLKSEIAQVYEIAMKPLTATREYAADELGPMIIFDPDLYVYAFHLEGYVPVLLYSASEPEDNSSAQCLPTVPPPPRL